MTLPLRLAALGAVLLAAPGCDLLGSADLLGDVSSADLTDLNDLLDDAGCSDGEFERLSGSESGTLDEDDCFAAEEEASDFYVFTVEEDAEVTVELSSDDFAPFLSIAEVDLDESGDEAFTEVGDAGDGEDDSVRISEPLDAGVYAVLVTTAEFGGLGDYTVSVEAESSDDDEDRPAAPVAGPASLRALRTR